MAKRRRLPRKDALLVFLVLLVAGLLMERFGGDDTLLRWLGKAVGQQVEYVLGGGSSHYMFLVLASQDLL